MKDNKNVETTLFEDMGRMGISTGGFTMNNVELPGNHLIGELDRGFYYAMEGFSAARVLIGATCIGASEAALELGVEHIKTRKAFGRPLGSFEGIQLPLAEHHCNIDAVKLQTYRAAWTMDQMYKEKKATHNDVAIAAATVSYTHLTLPTTPYV